MIAALAFAAMTMMTPNSSLAGQAPEETFQASRAWAHLEKQVAFGPRVPGYDAHIKCRDWIADEMRKSCENVRLQELSHVWSKTGKPVKMWNVIGEQNWKDAKVRVVLLAHWDTRPTADMEWELERQKQPIAGANDGASGVAVLLELMRVIKAKAPADLGIMYLMTDGEDLGPGLEEMFLGASAFAKALPTPKPDYGILLDMVGDKELRVPMEANSLRYAPHVLRPLYQHAKEIGLGDTFPSVRGQELYDDHLPLNRAGIPTIDLIDFDYAPWHTLGDTPDKCSPESLGKVGRLMESWLRKAPPFKP